MNGEKKRQIIGIVFRSLLIIVILLAIFAVAYIILRHFGFDRLSREQIQELITKTGPWGGLVFIFLSFLQVTIIPVPSAITILAGNYIFGFWLSALYSFIGIFLGSLAAFALGKLLGRKFVNYIVGDVSKVDEIVVKAKGKETITLFFMFLLPFFPDDALCSIAGILPIKWSVFSIIQVITRPLTIFGTLLFMSGEVIPFHGWGLVVIILACIGMLIAYIYAFKNSEKINDWFYKLINKITFKKKKVK